MRTKLITSPPLRLVLDGEFGVDIAELVTAKLSRLTRHVTGSILDIRVHLVRHPHPAAEPPVEAEVNLDLNGRLFRAVGAAHGVSDALDGAVNRLIRQLDERPARRRARGAHRR